MLLKKLQLKKKELARRPLRRSPWGDLGGTPPPPSSSPPLRRPWPGHHRSSTLVARRRARTVAARIHCLSSSLLSRGAPVLLRQVPSHGASTGGAAGPGVGGSTLPPPRSTPCIAGAGRLSLGGLWCGWSARSLWVPRPVAHPIPKGRRGGGSYFPLPRSVPPARLARASLGWGSSPR